MPSSEASPRLSSPSLSVHLVTATLSTSAAEEVHHTSRTAAAAVVALLVRVTEFTLVRSHVRGLRLHLLTAH